MKILYLTFYYEPDLGAGSFRNTTLAKTLSRCLSDNDCIDVITTFPHRYSSYNKDNIVSFEKKGNLHIYRITIPSHNNGFVAQINAFRKYFFDAKKKTKRHSYDLVFASSSRLFTAFLGYTIARKIKKPLYLDIRDIFVDTMQDVLKNKFIKMCILPFIKIVEKVTFNNAHHINLISEGFMPYFKAFKCKSYSYYTHGIDDEFLTKKLPDKKITDNKYTIVYAGNIGEGQGLEKIIPPGAELLGNNYSFLVIGDGGTKAILRHEVDKRRLANVELRDPIGREHLKVIYDDADFFFLHLNNYRAFDKVLPSKIFELAAYNKPIIAGVSGFSYQFIEKHIDNVILFRSCDVSEMVDKMKVYDYKNEYRTQFIREFRRDVINTKMAWSMIESVNQKIR